MLKSKLTTGAARTSKVVRRAAVIAVVTAAGAAGAATLAVGSANAASAPNTSCTPVHIITARASTEAAGNGIIGALTGAIQSGSKQKVSNESVNYPALLFPYDTSTNAGDAAIKSQLTAYTQKCPDAKIVLLGYSQGAQLVGDALGGGGGGFGLGAKNPPVPAAVARHVVAAVQMGDPRRVPGKSFDLGTAKNATGLFPRPADQSLDAFSGVIQSYCDTGDPFCASGLDVLAHLAYTVKYDAAATQFVLGKIGG